MGGKRKMVNGFDDVLENATSDLDVSRMIDAIDYPVDAKREETRIRDALRRLSAKDRSFARKVLRGMTWKKSGLTKRGFNKRLKKILDFFERPVNIDRNAS